MLKKNKLTIEDIDEIVRYLLIHMKDFKADKMKTIYYLVYYSGIAKEELLDIKRSDFNLDNCSLNIRITEHWEPRIAYYPEYIRDMIKEIFDREPEVNNAFSITNRKLETPIRVLQEKKFNGRRFTFRKLRVSGPKGKRETL